MPISLAQTVDTAVEKKGLTFKGVTESEALTSGIFTATCGDGTQAENDCNPYEGDKSCGVPRPLLCFLDIDAPVPETLSNPQYWTGGVLAVSPTKRGDSFSTLSNANAYCATIFGVGWRVASFHEGGGWAMKGYGFPQKSKTRLWIDIKDQPKATCWSR